jgi:integrase
LVFTSPVGTMLDLNYLTDAFRNEAQIALGRHANFHALRHTHITSLLRVGVPVHVVSARAGHSKSSTTLDVYAHLVASDDTHAARQADEALRRVLK